MPNASQPGTPNPATPTLEAKREKTWVKWLGNILPTVIAIVFFSRIFSTPLPTCHETPVKNMVEELVGQTFHQNLGFFSLPYRVEPNSLRTIQQTHHQRKPALRRCTANITLKTTQNGASQQIIRSGTYTIEWETTARNKKYIVTAHFN